MMAAMTLPYKLQVFMSDDLRHALKMMAYEEHTSLQKLVIAALELAVRHEELGTTEALREAIAAQSS
jgi:hypothetical protein